MKEEIAAAVVKATPPVAVVGSQVVSDISLDTWVKIATLLYLLLQAALLVRAELRKSREVK